MERGKIITLPRKRIKEGMERAKVERVLKGKPKETRGLVGAVTPLDATVEYAEEIRRLGGAVISRRHATAVKLPKNLSQLG